jgi:hypothetical protein
VQKRNRERKECEDKEKKRKEKKRNERRSTYQSCGSQIFKSRSRSTMKRSWSETWRGYKRL